LKPGYTAKVILDPGDQEPKPAAAASGQDQGPKPAATTGGQGNKGKKTWIILIFASAAATAGIVYCILNCGGPSAISPVTP
jgi:hypothetical protein